MYGSVQVWRSDRTSFESVDIRSFQNSPFRWSRQEYICGLLRNLGYTSCPLLQCSRWPSAYICPLRAHLHGPGVFLPATTQHPLRVNRLLTRLLFVNGSMFAGLLLVNRPSAGGGVSTGSRPLLVWSTGPSRPVGCFVTGRCDCDEKYLWFTYFRWSWREHLCRGAHMGLVSVLSKAKISATV